MQWSEIIRFDIGTFGDNINTGMILVHNLIRIMILAGHQSFLTPKDYYDRDEAARREVEQTFPYENGVYGKIYKRPLCMIQKLMKELLVMNLLLLL